jgi:3-phenylpropionate/cinnamic acid dioxygenase small subunit
MILPREATRSTKFHVQNEVSGILCVRLEGNVEPGHRIHTRRDFMNFEWANRRMRGLAAAVLSLLAGATAGSAFGQAKKDDAAAHLRVVEDRQAIEQLLMGDYPRALDSANWAAYGALFAKDGELIMQGGNTRRTGPAAIQDFFIKLPAFGGQAAPTTPSPCPVPSGTPRTMHVVTNLSLHIDGDTATDQAYWETIATRDCKSVVAGAGHYEDVLKREDGKWRFAKREIFDDLPPRAAAAPAAAAPAAPKP